MINNHSVSEVVEEIKHSLKVMQNYGWKGFDCSVSKLNTLDTWNKITDVSKETLQDVLDDLGKCSHCRLAQERTHIVFGAGNPDARLLFIGEGPGSEEDKQGQPFVGAAGRLLSKIIQAMNLTRDQVYICNIIKCRPPGNRNPEPEEIKVCMPYLLRQIDAVSPEFICTLGSVAARTLLGTTEYISKLRGRFHEYRGIKVMPTYHPAYLLRNPEKKRDVWEDMKMLMKEMGL